MKIKRIISILLIAAFMTVALGATALATVPAVTNRSARVYQYPSGASLSIGVPKGFPVTIGAIANGWAWVSNDYNGCKAFIPLSWLTPTTYIPAYTTGTTATYAWNLTRMGTLSGGTGVYALGTIGSYYLVSNTARTGLAYVPAGSITPATSGNTPAPSIPTPSNPNLTGIEKVLATAVQLLGTPYSSLDCSTFVRYCMNTANYPAGDTALHQAQDGRYALIANPADLQRGDILCFDTSGNGEVDHTAFYLGGGKFIESSQKAGKVQYNDLDATYYGFFVCARRIIT